MKEVHKVLDELNVKYETVNHPPLFTCADSDKFNVKFDGVGSKNLFIRNKNKTQYYLVATLGTKRINLKQLQKKLQESKLSFGSDQELWEKLKTKSGAVSVLDIIAATNTDVIFIIDDEIFKHKKVGFHPRTNSATTLFSPNDLTKLLESYNAKYKIMNLD